MSRRYLDAKAAAEYLGFGTDDRGLATLYQWVHRGRLPYSKIGRSLRFDIHALDQWMADNATGAKEAESA